jgi:hypothetical protein
MDFGTAMRRATIDQLSFNLRATGLRGRRTWRNLRQGPSRLQSVDDPDSLAMNWPIVAGNSITKLWTIGPAAEWLLTAGKIQNLRQAIGNLHGLKIPAGSTFSFWRHVDRPVARHGYVTGRELREGCLVASTGGGLCQLSNALYAAAVAAGCDIVERHRHSRVIPGSLAELGLDATVFWNYVDLRFQPAVDMVIDVRLTATELILCLRRTEEVVSQTDSPLPAAADRPTSQIPAATLSTAPGDCLTCGETSCVYVIRQSKSAGRTAWLLDEYWPEFDLWQRSQRTQRDHLYLPLDGHRWRRRNYAWSLPAPDQRTTYPLLTLSQARRIRATSTQGAMRQQALMERDKRLAEAYHRDLPFDADHLIVALNLLPHLWRLGTLGGRRFSVFMTRSPLPGLQHALDGAALLHAASPTLRDFRAPAWLVSAEEAALAAAEMLITPHRQLATDLNVLYPRHVKLIDWALPDQHQHQHQHLSSDTESCPAVHRQKQPADRQRVLFAASGLARKGAYEMRAAPRHLSIDLYVLGRAQDSADFWQGTDIKMVEPGADALAGIDCVVLPAFVEHQPRLLLRAIARGIPVICSPACGLAGHAGVTVIDAGNPAALAAAITASLLGSVTLRKSAE